MKKGILFRLALVTGLLLTSCGQAENMEEADLPSDAAGNSYHTSMMSGSDASEPNGQSEENLKANEQLDTEMEVVEDIVLSDQILRAGDTMQVMDIIDEDTLYHELDITLHEAEIFDSPQASGLDRSLMLEETENYDTSEDPEWCSIDEAKILVCDLTVRNIGGDGEGELNISEFMIAYADPDTGKVTIISCGPAYFSASSSQVGASDYYHYSLSEGESRDMTVAWLIQENYEPENLYLCVTYDVRIPRERQYFKIL